MGVTENDTVGTLDDIISLFENSTEEKPKEIFAAALSLRDTTGRDRKQVLRNLARTWGGVNLREKRGGLWKDRPYADVTADITRGLCDAASAAICLNSPSASAGASAEAPPRPQGASSSGKRGGPAAGQDDPPPAKQSKRTGTPADSSGEGGGGTQRDLGIHGWIARRAAEARAGAEEHGAGEEAAEACAAEDGAGGEAAGASVVEHGPGAAEEKGTPAKRRKVQAPVEEEAGPLFKADHPKDQAALVWLSEHSGVSRCAKLLEQIEAWGAVENREG